MKETEGLFSLDPQSNVDVRRSCPVRFSQSLGHLRQAERLQP